MDYSKSKPGDNNYRAYIGPPMQYDFMGATQFRLLCTLGLRAEHKVLDLGCGSLRAGRFLISYLERGNYYGIEPNKWLIEEAIKDQLGSSIIEIKKPSFDHNSEFDTHVFNSKFDYIIAQSIFSHTGLDLLEIALKNIKTSLTPSGVALVTFIKGEHDFEGSGWVYPGCVEFTQSTILSFVKKIGLQVKELPWFHPRQTWFILSTCIANLPLDSEFSFLSGAVLRSTEFKTSIIENLPLPALPVIKSPKTLIVTGFHRSATSATANYLFDAGLDMGANLMGSNISNAKGHFEDWDAVLLHDAQLAKSDTNWQFHEQCELNSEPEFLNAYIKKRSEQHLFWGLKDPRACLFLNEWKNVLGGGGHFLFVVRHWSSCIESLLHRHSREMAYALPQLNRDSVGCQFWIQPELAAKMWLSYNQRLLTFAKANPEQTLVVTQRALFEGVPIIESINRKFAFELNEKVDSPFDPRLFRDKASQSVFSQLSHALQAQLNVVWSDLLELATFKSEDESPVIVPDKVDKEALQAVYTQADKLVCEAFLSDAHGVDIDIDIGIAIDERNGDGHLQWQTALNNIVEPSAMVTHLDKTAANTIDAVKPNEWLAVIDRQFSLNGQVLLSTAKLLMKTKAFELAIGYFQQAVSVGAYFPYVDMMIAQCKQALGLFNEAEFFFQKAIKANPNNPTFYTNYAKLLVVQKHIEDASLQFQQGFEKGKKQPACIVPYCDFLAKENKLEKAIHIAEQFIAENEHPAIQNLLIGLKLQQDIELGQQHYVNSMANKLKDKDTIGWLAKSCLLIDSSIAEQDFINRCLAHWKALS